MSKNAVETIVGAAVLCVAIGFGYYATNEINLNPDSGYKVSARFSNVDGIGNGSEVRIGGIKVGVVSDMDLDPKTYEALINLNINRGIKVPEDSSANIVSSGLLGSKYVSIAPGASDEILVGGDEISFTQSSINIETLIGKMVHSGGGIENSDDVSGSNSSGSSLLD